MTTNTPQPPAVEAKCQKCGSRAKSVEYDLIGWTAQMVITCTTCGKCVYMDRNNQPIEEQPELKKRITGFHKFGTPESSTSVEAAPQTRQKSGEGTT